MKRILNFHADIDAYEAAKSALKKLYITPAAAMRGMIHSVIVAQIDPIDWPFSTKEFVKQLETTKHPLYKFENGRIVIRHYAD